MRHFSRAIAIVLILVSGAAAQEVTSGSIAGQVLDQQNLPLPGATVTVTAGQGSQNFTTDEQGRFLAPFLTPGSYTVRIELQGFHPAEQRSVEVRLGQRADLGLKLTVGGMAETVEVTGTRAVVDVTNTTVGANIDSDMLARIPVQRRLSDTMYLAPGVSSGGGTGRANPSVSGASGLENQYVVDEVNITKPGSEPRVVLDRAWIAENRRHLRLHPGSPGDDRRLRSPVGQATGGVVNVVTKTGRTDSAERRSATSSPPLPRALSNRCRRLRRHASKP